MATDPFDALVLRNAPQFLAGNYRTLPRNAFRGVFHDAPPDRRVLTGQTLPNVPSLTFVPLLKQLGAIANQRTSAGVAAWVKTATYLLGRVDDDDQREVMQKYQTLKSFSVSPSQMLPGFLYTFRYQAKANQFDRFPLTLVLDKDKTSILGLNFHYLPLIWRFAFFEALMPLIAPLPVSQRTRILATYQRLSIGTKYYYWESTVKRYTMKQIQSRAIFITPIEWAAAIAYPSDMFIRTTSNIVYTQSLRNK